MLVDAEKHRKEAMFNKKKTALKQKVSAMGTLKMYFLRFQDALKNWQTGDALNQRKISVVMKLI